MSLRVRPRVNKLKKDSFFQGLRRRSSFKCVNPSERDLSSNYSLSIYSEGRTRSSTFFASGPRGVRCKRLELTVHVLLCQLNAESESVGTCENH